jgi:hypothetical protein
MWACKGTKVEATFFLLEAALGWACNGTNVGLPVFSSDEALGQECDGDMSFVLPIIMALISR